MLSSCCNSSMQMGAQSKARAPLGQALRNSCGHPRLSTWPSCVVGPSQTALGPAWPSSKHVGCSRPLHQAGQLISVVPQAHPAHWSLLLASVTAASNPGPAITATASSLPAYLTSIGIFIVCSAAAVFLVSAIPTLWALARLAHQATNVLRQVERELPETASMLRLSGLEVTDCINEFAGLGSDLSKGVRSAAQMVTMTEAGVKQAAAAAGTQLVPTLAANETAVRGVVEAGLQERAKMQYSAPLISQAATSTTAALRKVRLGVAVAQLTSAAVRLGQAARGRAQQVAQHYQQGGSRQASPDPGI